MLMRSCRSLAALLLGGTLVGGCAGEANPEQAGRTGSSATVVQTGAGSAVGVGHATVRHVVAISIDGLNPRAVKVLGPDGAPALHRMRREGAGTMNARTLRERTVTLPNHATMLTGRKARGDRGHGVLANVDPGGTVHDLADGRVRSVFTVVHHNEGTTSLYTTKPKFDLFRRSWPRAVHTFRLADGATLVDEVTAGLAGEPDTLAFLHLGLPDVTGHEHGFLGDEYLAAVRRVDTWVGRILDVIASDAGLAAETVVLLTADHGGRGGGHSDRTRPSNYRVPFLAWGAGVTEGVNLYRLNPHLDPPGKRRTAYRGAQPVRNGDLANLATDLLGMPDIRGSRFNRDQRLRVSR